VEHAAVQKREPPQAIAATNNKTGRWDIKHPCV